MKKITTKGMKPASYILSMGKTFKTKQQWVLYVTYFSKVGKVTLTVDKKHKFSTKIPFKLFDREVAKQSKK
jgi:hypothetical protein